MVGEPIDQQGDGSKVRDYTFIGDIVNGVLRASRWDDSNFEIFNLGDRRPTPSLSASAGSRMRLGKKWRSGSFRTSQVMSHGLTRMLVILCSC